MTGGKYDSEKIYNLIYKDNLSISTVEFKYGIHRNEILTLLNQYHSDNLTVDFLTTAHKGDVISTTYIYDYNMYFIIGEVIKKNLNSVIVNRIDGDELPIELLEKVVVGKNNLTILKKKPN